MVVVRVKGNTVVAVPTVIDSLHSATREGYGPDEMGSVHDGFLACHGG